MEPPREAEAMDPELAAALGIQISDERTQEANVLGARLATGVSAPPLSLAFLGGGFFAGGDAFPPEALEKLVGLAQGGDAASILRAALGAVGDDALAVAVLRAALQRERPAAEPAPVEPTRMSLRDHRRAERQRAMANGLEIAAPVPGSRPAPAPARRAGPARGRGADAWRPLGATVGAAQPTKRRRRAAPAPAPALMAPNTVPCPVCGEAVGVDPRRPDAAMDAHLQRCGRRRRRVVVDESDSDVSYSDASEDAQRALELRAAASDDDKSSSSDDDDEGPLRLRSTEKIADDGTDAVLRARLEGNELLGESDTEEDHADALRFPGGFVLRASLATRLYAHQRRAVSWLWDLWRRGEGGVVGDEMGLGKTAQVGAFLGAVADRRELSTCLVLAPTTMLAHWRRELETWAPRGRVVVLHRSAEAFDDAAKKGPVALAEFLARALSPPDSSTGATFGVVICSYEGLRRLSDALLAKAWGCVILDEGQKIRNPEASITRLTKHLRTPRRYLLSGTPVQNSLTELWSLFDFAVPGRLGTLRAFDDELAAPIRHGGYANATPAKVQLAYRCALALRDLLKPYLLRRTKAALNNTQGGISLPPKTEHVLLCRLSEDQLCMYKSILDSDDVRIALERRGERSRGGSPAFRAIAALRAVCNHPDIYGGAVEGTSAGSVDRSAKLRALDAVLQRWKAQRHRALVFSQSVKMLDILEALAKQRGFSYARMDGSTPPQQRQATCDAFNLRTSKTFCMLLTTRTGGVGLNLIGADCVALYDPDWNPQTDAQARERCWRIGQTKPVTVYRFVCAGTIEEKIYHRQIFKQALTNRVLTDARQRRLFSQSELSELFTLGEGAYPDGDNVVTAEDFAAQTAGADEEVPDAEDDQDVLQALWDGAADSDLAGVLRAAADDASEGVQAAAQREALRAVEAVARTRRQAQQLASSDLLGAIARRRRDARDEASAVRDEEAPSGDAVALVGRLDAYLAAHAPPTTDVLLDAFADVRDAHLFRSVLRQLAERRSGVWRRK